MNEISNALNTGKEVITHTDDVNVPGWSGAGYIIYGPVTGDGAYKIGGGANGSNQEIEDHSGKIFMAIAAGVSGVAFAFLSGAIILGIFLAILFVIDLSL